jgi:hypothetical protein
MTVTRYPADPAIVAYVLNAELGEEVQEAWQTTLFGITTTCVLLTNGGTIHHWNQLNETRYYDAKGRLTCTVEY